MEKEKNNKGIIIVLVVIIVILLALVILLSTGIISFKSTVFNNNIYFLIFQPIKFFA